MTGLAADMASRADRDTPTNRSPAATISLMSVRGPVITTQVRPKSAFTWSAWALISSNTLPPPVMMSWMPGTSRSRSRATCTS